MGTQYDTGLDHITDEAAAWFTRNGEPGLADEERARFAQWLAATPVNVREYLSIAQLWGTLQSAGPWPAQSAEQLIALARSAPNVMPFPTVKAEAMRRAPGGGKATRRRLRWAAASGLAALIAMLYLFAPADWLSGRHFATARGEQRSLVLSDGSVVQLNTLTRAVIRFSSHTRRIELSEGEALFRVARDSTRPFEVVTPDAIVQAVGTEFDVYSRARGTRIAVVEGRVRVAVLHGDASGPKVPVSSAANAHDTGGSAAMALGPQESLNISAKGGATRRAIPRPAVTTAWVQRRLVFDDEPLDQVIEEFNRYNSRQIQISDPALAALRISGVFSADDPGALLKYLEKIQGVTIVPERGAVLTLRRAAPTPR